MIKIENKANRIVMWILITLGLVEVFLFSLGFGMGLVEGFRGY